MFVRRNRCSHNVFGDRHREQHRATRCRTIRIKNTQEDRLDDLLERYQPLEVVVETSPAWPWLFDRLEGNGIRFVLAHAKRLRVIAESNYKSDDIDAELLARMRLAGLIPEVHPKCVEQREQAVLLRIGRDSYANARGW